MDTSQVSEPFLLVGAVVQRQMVETARVLSSALFHDARSRAEDYQASAVRDDRDYPLAGHISSGLWQPDAQAFEVVRTILAR